MRRWLCTAQRRDALSTAAVEYVSFFFANVGSLKWQFEKWFVYCVISQYVLYCKLLCWMVSKYIHFAL